MSPVVRSVLLALQRENDPTRAAALINSLADPFLRRRVRVEWEALRASTVIELETSA